MCSCLHILQMRVLDCWGFQHADSWVSYTLSYLCISTDRIHKHPFRGADLPFQRVRTILLVGTSSKAASQLQLWKTAKAVVGESPWHPPAAVVGLFPDAEQWCPAKLGTWHWERSCDGAQGDAYALQTVSHRWSDLFNALWWLFTFAG